VAINVVLGIPASGKSRFEKEYVARLVNKGYRVLWLTPLKSEAHTTAVEFVNRYGLEPTQVKILFSKLDYCERLKRIQKTYKTYNTLIGLAACLSCPVSSSVCPFKQAIRDAMRGSPGLYIATHQFFWLSPMFYKVVVDESDYLIPDIYFQMLSEQQINITFKILRKLFSEDIVEKIKNKYIVKIDFPEGTKYMIRSRWIVKYFVDERIMSMVSATLPVDKEVFNWYFGCDNEFELEDTIGDRLYLVKMKPPQRQDKFYVLLAKNYFYSSIRYETYYYIPRIVKRYLKEDKSITIVCRSKKEVYTLYDRLKKSGIKKNYMLAENINWFKKNVGDWMYYPVRLLVVGGKFYRSLNMDSDVTIGFYQHLSRDDKERLVQHYYYIVNDPYEIVDFIQYRKHIQTVFRSIRNWNKSHTVLLLDSTYIDSIDYFKHISEYVVPRMRRITINYLKNYDMF